MALRVADVDELARLATVCTGGDAAGNWASLDAYLQHAATAATEPVPYVRNVDVLWLNQAITPPGPYCQNRRFRVTYTGRARQAGGFASQGYCVVEPAWNSVLQPHHQDAISVDWYPGVDRDLIVVTP